jgi:hypothetical protein
VCEATALDHELGDNAVKLASFVVQWFPRFTSSFLACAQGTT